MHLHALVDASTRGEILLSRAHYAGNKLLLSEEKDYKHVRKLWQQHT